MIVNIVNNTSCIFESAKHYLKMSTVPKFKLDIIYYKFNVDL